MNDAPDSTASEQTPQAKQNGRLAFLRSTSLVAMVGVFATVFTAFTSYNADRAANTIEESKRRMEQQRQDFEREKFAKEYLLNLQDKVGSNLSAGKPELAVALVLNEPPCTNTRAKLANLLVNADYVSAAFEGPKAKSLQATINQLKDESRNADPNGGAPITCQIEDSEHRIADLQADLDAIVASQKGSLFAFLDHRDEDIKKKLETEISNRTKLQTMVVQPSPAATAVAAAPPAEAPQPVGSGAATAPIIPTPAVPTPPASQAALSYAGNARGWDIDVFYCEGSDANRQTATLVASKLIEQAKAKRAIASGFDIGRIRVRTLRDDINVKAGYTVAVDEIRAEVAETEQGNALAAFLAKSNVGNFAIHQSAMATPWYLSVFACSASTAPADKSAYRKSSY